MTQKELLICLTNNPLKGSSKKERKKKKVLFRSQSGGQKNFKLLEKNFKHTESPRTHVLMTLISLITEVISTYLEKKACYR